MLIMQRVNITRLRRNWRCIALVAFFTTLLWTYAFFPRYWYASSNFTLPSYIQLHSAAQFRALDKILLDEHRICERKDFRDSPVLIIVKSNAVARRQRDMLRRTWLRDAVSLNIPHLFLTGMVNYTLPIVQLLEAKQHRDLIVGNFNENYYNNTLKSVTAIKWHVTRCAAKYLFYCDDDVVVNVKNVLKFVRGISKNENAGPVIYGKRQRWPLVMRSGKWGVPPSVYANDRYPDYCSGVAVIYDQNATRAINKVISDDTFGPRLWIDDVFVNGISAEAAKISLVHDERFVTIQDTYAVFDENIAIGQVGRGQTYLNNYKKILKNKPLRCWQRLFV